MPISRSSITKIGVCSRSARSKAWAPNSKLSVGFSGNSSTCLVSPCEAYAHEIRSHCCVLVGIPVGVTDVGEVLRDPEIVELFKKLNGAGAMPVR